MLVVLIRFAYKNFDICQRLIRVHVLAKSLNGQQIAREVITALSTDLQYPAERVISAVRDGASVNEAAIRMLKAIMYPNTTSIICVAHSLDNIGRHFNTDLLDSFFHLWISLFSHSPASRMLWKTQTGERIKTYS